MNAPSPAAAAGGLAERIRRGDRLLGTLLRMPNDALVELTGLVGMDFVLLDTEHGPGDLIPLTQHIVAAQANGLGVLVRVGHLHEVLRVLDLGAQGIVAPHISSAEQARELVRMCRYPPDGDRGFATYTRRGRYGLSGSAEHLAAAGRELAVFAMVEDPAAVPGVTGVFVGPADLALAMGLPGRGADERVRSAVQQVHTAARHAGKAVLTIASDAVAARKQFAAGSDLVVYNVQATLVALLTGLAAARPAGNGSRQEPDRAAGRSGGSAARRVSAGSALGEAGAGSPGEPLVLVPGMLADGAVWNDVAGRLRDQVEVRTARIDLDDSVSGLAESVLAAAPPRFALAGHSLGGIVALEIQRQAPERVTRLALLNCSARPGSPEQIEAWQAMAGQTEGGDFAAVVDDLALANLPETRRDDRQLIDCEVRMARSVGPAGLLRQLSAQATRPDSRPLLGRLGIPVLVISGERDQVCPPRLQEELVGLLGEARHITMPDTGHLPMLESPEALAEHLSAWLGW